MDRKKNGQWQTVASNDPKNNSLRSIYLNSKAQFIRRASAVPNLILELSST